MLAAEKRAVKDIHSLELVVARQDARYEELQQRLKNNNKALSMTSDGAILNAENEELEAKEQEVEELKKAQK